MYDMSDIRKNLKITLDGQPYTVIEFQFVKPGKGQAFTRTRVKNLLTGNVVERTFKANERIEPADVEEREMQYLYPEGDTYVFMDSRTYEQVRLTAEQLGDSKGYLLDNLPFQVLFWNGQPVGATPPVFVEMEVIETEPGFKGDTSGNVLKPAKVSTGLEVGVPLFINRGEWIKIDTRTGEYVERIRK
jgi:elongation factor P